MMITPQNPDQEKSYILVVDDENELCQMVATCLQQASFCISSVNNTADAYKMLEQEHYDVIITDVLMPDEDGITFLGRVHQTWPDLPVIIMTAFAKLQMAVDAIKSGAFDFVYKPFDFGHMRKIVERAVNYSRLQRLEKNYRIELEETIYLRTNELKSAMVELDLVKSALLNSATKRNEYMANISHELRTPMNGVVGGVALLEDEITSANGKEYLAMVSQSAENMVTLINQILTFGGGSGPDRETNYTLFSPVEVLRAVASELQPGFSMKGITLNLRFFADSNVKIWSDKEHFERLFVILLGNALKFTDQGTVALEVTIEDMADNYNHLQISVTDSGVGIPEGMLEQIFEPFIQGDGSHTRRHGGIGLGLAIAQQNAMILNGKLRAEHVLTGGSSFKFSMKTITIQ